MNLQYIKDNFYKLTTIAAILLLVAVQGQAWVSAQESDSNTKPTEVKGEQQAESKSLTPLELSQMNLQGSSSSYPHLNCIQDLLRTGTPSDEYVADVPYNLQFHTSGGSNVFQDINGDSLPDYVYAFNTVDGGTNLLQTYAACVYLNNGAGWDKAYQCYAVTETVVATGNINNAEYYGDCAGESAASGNSKE